MACRRTFSDFTGTPLAHLKRIECWPEFCDCVLSCLTVRATGRRLGVDKDTAFRWRHRVLESLDGDDASDLAFSVTLEETWFPHSEKGSRSLDRPPRRRAALHRCEMRPAWVVVALDDTSRPATGVVGEVRPRAADLAALLSPRLTRSREIVSTSGYYGAPARLATLVGLPHRRVMSPAPEVRAARRYIIALHRWIARFRGVATRYLGNYLAWHRFLTVAALPSALGVITRVAVPRESLGRPAWSLSPAASVRARRRLLVARFL